MEWILDNKWAQIVIIYAVILLVLTLIAFILAAFESEHYLNSPFRGGKKIKFKTALRNYMIGLYLVVILMTVSYFGIVELFKTLDTLPKIIISAGAPLLAMGAAFINSKNEKYLFLKIKEFIEGFLTIITILALVVGGIGYYMTYIG